MLIAIPIVVFLVVMAINLLYQAGLLVRPDYGLAWVITGVVITLITVWRGIQLLPSGFATSSERSLTLDVSFEGVCRIIPLVVSKNHWKMQEVDLEKGHFKARIGWSWHTIGSTFLIDVTGIDPKSVKIHAFCGTRSSADPGHNEKMLTKFLDGLGKATKDGR